jgi:long-subunit acyl-CoA synthetase (AMP-forming)
MENVNKVVKTRCLGLMNSKKTFLDIFNVMFSTNDYILGEWNDGYKINSITYLEAKKKIFNLAYSINQKYPNLKDQYIGIAMESSIEWVLSFWAILASGNKPYLVNLRHPHELVNHLLKSLNVEYVIELDSQGYDAKGISYLELKEEAKDFTPSFADEMALSTSATTLKEKIIFYNGLEISSQILNCKKILEENKQIKKHYKGRLKQLVFLPLYHIFGFMATYMWFSFFGRTMVFLKDYSKDTILYTIKKHEVTHLFAVPLFWNTIEKEILKGVKEKNKEKKFNKGLKLCIALQKVFPNYGIKKSKRIMHEVTDSLFGKSVLFCISGGSYIKEDTLRLINGLGYPLYNGYGMSEIGITSVELGSIKDRLKNSIGKPFESIQYEIKDNKLYVGGTSISHKMKINGEYVYNNDRYSTEDIVKKDKDNRYYILGRSDDLFIGPNGENINPDQI